MINENFTISMKAASSAFVNWEAPGADYVSFLFMNGVKQFGPMFFDDAIRNAAIGFTRSMDRAIEIHDFPALAGDIMAVEIRENNRPIIKWRTIEAATRYRVYHTPFGGSESLIYDQPVPDLEGTDQVRIKSPINLVEGWHLFRVESVDVFGNESTHIIWPYQVFRLPEPVNTLTIANGSGLNLFDITITE